MKVLKYIAEYAWCAFLGVMLSAVFNVGVTDWKLWVTIVGMSVFIVIHDMWGQE